MRGLQKLCFTPKGFVSFLWDLWDHTFPPSAEEAVFPRVREEASAQSKERSWGQGLEDRESHWSPAQPFSFHRMGQARPEHSLQGARYFILEFCTCGRAWSL